MRGERVAYRLAATAAREAFRRARSGGCSMEELVVLQVVVSLTALYSKLSDEIGVAQIAEEAEMHPKNVARALRSLAAREIILYEPGRGRGNVSRIGLPDPTTEQGADETPIPQRDMSKKGADSTPKREPTGAPLYQSKKGADSAPKREPLTRGHTRARSLLGPEKEPRRKNNSSSMGQPSTELVKRIDLTDEVVAESATVVLDVFNEEAETDYRAAKYLAMIAERIRERPDVDLESHRRAIQRTLRLTGKARWWKGNPSPNMVYAHELAFEMALNLGPGHKWKESLSADDLYEAALEAEAHEIHPERLQRAEPPIVEHHAAFPAPPAPRKGRPITECMSCDELRPLEELGSRWLCDECRDAPAVVDSRAAQAS